MFRGRAERFPGPLVSDVLFVQGAVWTRLAFLSLSGFVAFVTYIVDGHRGDGAMTAFDYIAIGVLIALGVFAVASAFGGKFKL
jgi:hypothetical protein